ARGYNNFLTNVQSVYYTATDVYVKCTSVPDYTIGPWQSNPNTPAQQNFTFKITRTPTKNTGNPVQTPLGHTGVWSNGVSIFNAKDGMTYMNQGKWNRDALFWEGISFDNCLGHPAPGGEYHHHVNPTCLYDDTDSTHHSPIIGYAFDGYPIYGAYGYANTNGTGAIVRMRTSFVVTTATTRASGPAMTAQYPAGCFIEDYSYVAGSGDLDDHNGRFCITPEYPNGTYAYFVTIDAQRKPVYPYSPGPTYYGVVQAGNTGPGSGRNTVPANAVVYTPSTTTPGVTIATTAPAVVCQGTPVTFTATPVNGGSSPAFEWKKNGTTVGSNTPTYTDAALKSNDSVWCVMTSNLAGANPATVSSKAIVMNITPKVTPSVRIASTPAAFCEGSSVTVSGSVTNGGNAAQLTWLVNGKTAGSAAVLALASLKQSDTVMLELKSSATCAEPSIVRSAPLTFTVYPLPPEPTVAFAKGTLTAIIGGGTLTVQWYRNNTLIDGATNTTYEPKENGDYSVSVTNEWGCVSRSSAISVVLSGVEDEPAARLRVAPNPFNADVHIIPATDIPNAEVRITDGLGRNVVTVRNARLSAGTAWRLPLGPELASGVYHVHVESESRQTVLRCFKR
ncbi:MAG: YHYH protein, partial [Candidatus Kapaibacterium sp.]